MNKQLYRLHSKVWILPPELTPTVNHTNPVLEGAYTFLWPDNSPCIPIELYLSELTKATHFSIKDGGTLGSKAKNLSHLVRYCFYSKVSFEDLQHRNIDELIKQLCQEVNEDGYRVRNNNTVKTIINDIIDFLKWLQQSLFVDRKVVGVDTSNRRFQIKLTKKRSGKDYYHFNAEVFQTSLPRATKNIKYPVTNVNIQRITDSIFKSKQEGKVSNKLKAKFTKEERLDHLDYLFRRREIQVHLLEATGLRPQELITIVCSDNKLYLPKAQLLIPTKKRRESGSNRLIPIPRNLAIKIENFINIHRQKLVKRLVSSQIIQAEQDIDDVIYLNSETGKEVCPGAAYQEFRRIALKAGIEEKICQTMFRHRFITNMVKLHLIAFMDKNPIKSRHLMTDNDYRTILKKVATFTGHKDVNSIFHYLDFAWEELGAFEFADNLGELQNKLQSIRYVIQNIKHELDQLNGKILNQKSYENVIAQLLEIKSLSE